jgi:hypothetical protein
MENELEVKLSSGVLTIRGEKKEERKEEQPSTRLRAALRIIRAVIPARHRRRENRREIRERSADDPPPSEEALQKEKRIPIKTSRVRGCAISSGLNVQ